MQIPGIPDEQQRGIREIASRHGVQDIRVFGSVARGEASEASDIDFLVRFESGRTLLDQVALTRELESYLDTEVDVVTVGALEGEMRRRVLEQAVRL